MPDYFQNMNLSAHSFKVVHVRNLALIKDFDRNFLFSQNMHSFLDFTKGALAESLGNAVGSDTPPLRLLLCLFLIRHYND